MFTGTEAWQPTIYDESDDGQEAQARALCADPTIEVLDTLDLQRRELRQLAELTQSSLVDEPARWVFYPWRRCIVRLVGPTSFTRLRLDRNRNKITGVEQARLREQKIAVVGLSVGHAIAHTLALEGLCGELRLADFDTIELSNLNRIPGTVLDIGQNKAIVAARRVAEIDPYLKVVVFTDGVNYENLDQLLDGLHIVIEECDSLNVKLAVREAARARGIPVIMETSDRGLLDVERFDVNRNAPIFHGLLDNIRSSDLEGLETRDKVPHVLRLLEADKLSPRMAASMAEIDRTLSSWPQLGGDVTLGAASAAAAVRRIGRGAHLASGRTRIDLEAELDRLDLPDLERSISEPAVLLLDDVPEEIPAPADFTEAVAHAAGLAPSGGNTQPWRFEAADSFRIFLVPERSSTMDVAFRGSYVAIGAAAFNARVAAAAHGRVADLELFPRSDQSNLVAELRFRPGVDLDVAELYPAVLKRCTNRNFGERTPLAPEVRNILSEEAARGGARLRLLTGEAALDECAELLAESDRLRFLSPHLHREMMSELRWPGLQSTEFGIDVRTLALDRSDLAKLEVARRRDVMDYLADWDGGRSLGDATRERVQSSSAIAVVTTDGSSPVDFVRGGAALERIWLTAEKHGLAVHPVSPVFLYAASDADFDGLTVSRRVAECRELARRFSSLADLSPGESPVLVVRLSYAPPPPARSERFPLSYVLRVAPRSSAQTPSR